MTTPWDPKEWRIGDRPRPKGIRKHADQSCHFNAWKVAVDKNLRYVEGVAISSVRMPIHHAWCVDADDQVVEVTWSELGSLYYGTEAPIKEVSARIAENGYAELIFPYTRVMEGFIKVPPDYEEQQERFMEQLRDLQLRDLPSKYKTKLEIAENLLRNLFSESKRVPIEGVVRAGRDAGVSYRTLQRARVKLGIRSVPNGPYGAFWETS